MQNVNLKYLDFEKKVYQTLEKYYFTKHEKQYGVAVSGGPDSMLLSYFLKSFGLKNGYKVHAVIIDHQFRKSSFEEANITLDRLKMSKIDAEIIKLDKNCRNSGLQEWAHFKRLEILSSIAQSKNALLFLGHHLNDQVETVFMRMSKNTGFWGSSGIKFFNNWFDSNITTYCLFKS